MVHKKTDKILSSPALSPAHPVLVRGPSVLRRLHESQVLIVPAGLASCIYDGAVNMALRPVSAILKFIIILSLNLCFISEVFDSF